MSDHTRLLAVNAYRNQNVAQLISVPEFGFHVLQNRKDETDSSDTFQGYFFRTWTDFFIYLVYNGFTPRDFLNCNPLQKTIWARKGHRFFFSSIPPSDFIEQYSFFYLQNQGISVCEMIFYYDIGDGKLCHVIAPSNDRKKFTILFSHLKRTCFLQASAADFRAILNEERKQKPDLKVSFQPEEQKIVLAWSYRKKRTFCTFTLMNRKVFAEFQSELLILYMN